MKVFRYVLMGLGSLAVVVGVALLALTQTRDDLSKFSAYVEQRNNETARAVTVTYMGNTNLLISDGETSILTDGWSTRPSTLDVAIGKIEPDLDAIANGMERGGVGKLAAIIPVHSHFDHAMDAPEVARRTGGLLVGSESTANIGRGWGLPEEQISVIGDGDVLRFGDFTVTMILSRHFAFPNAAMRDAALEEPVIAEPLVPPVGALDYKEGGSYTIHVAHPLGSLLLQGSAGFIPGGLDGVKADIVALGVGGVAAQTTSYQSDYWEHVVRVTQPRKVYAVHWDSLTDPLADQPVMPNLLWSRVLDFQAEAGVAYALEHAAKDGIEGALFPMWEPVTLFSE
jgi:L-ascorbate metabolism protein UlaG (beta-lactamase superfamily)